MKQKLFNFLGHDFVIKDEAGRETFLVTSEFGIRKKFSFQDLAGKELAFIEQGLWSATTYDICKGDAIWAVVHKKGRTFLS
jgi:uncharacterized protein YxjI